MLQVHQARSRLQQAEKTPDVLPSAIDNIDFQKKSGARDVFSLVKQFSGEEKTLSPRKLSLDADAKRSEGEERKEFRRTPERTQSYRERRTPERESMYAPRQTESTQRDSEVSTTSITDYPAEYNDETDEELVKILHRRSNYLDDCEIQSGNVGDTVAAKSVAAYEKRLKASKKTVPAGEHNVEDRQLQALLRSRRRRTAMNEQLAKEAEDEAQEKSGSSVPIVTKVESRPKTSTSTVPKYAPMVNKPKPDTTITKPSATPCKTSQDLEERHVPLRKLQRQKDVQDTKEVEQDKTSERRPSGSQPVSTPHVVRTTGETERRMIASQPHVSQTASPHVAQTATPHVVRTTGETERRVSGSQPVSTPQVARTTGETERRVLASQPHVSQTATPHVGRTTGETEKRLSGSQPVSTPHVARTTGENERRVNRSQPHVSQTTTPHFTKTTTPYLAQTATPHVAQTATPHLAQTATPHVVRTTGETEKRVSGSHPHVAQTTTPHLAQTTTPNVAQTTTPHVVRTSAETERRVSGSQPVSTPHVTRTTGETERRVSGSQPVSTPHVVRTTGETERRVSGSQPISTPHVVRTTGETERRVSGSQPVSTPHVVRTTVETERRVSGSQPVSTPQVVRTTGETERRVSGSQPVSTPHVVRTTGETERRVSGSQPVSTPHVVRTTGDTQRRVSGSQPHVAQTTTQTTTPNVVRTTGETERRVNGSQSVSTPHVVRTTGETERRVSGSQPVSTPPVESGEKRTTQAQPASAPKTTQAMPTKGHHGQIMVSDIKSISKASPVSITTVSKQSALKTEPNDVVSPDLAASANKLSDAVVNTESKLKVTTTLHINQAKQTPEGVPAATSETSVAPQSDLVCHRKVTPVTIIQHPEAVQYTPPVAMPRTCRNIVVGKTPTEKLPPTVEQPTIVLSRQRDAVEDKTKNDMATEVATAEEVLPRTSRNIIVGKTPAEKVPPTESTIVLPRQSDVVEDKTKNDMANKVATVEEVFTLVSPPHLTRKVYPPQLVKSASLESKEISPASTKPAQRFRATMSLDAAGETATSHDKCIDENKKLSAVSSSSPPSDPKSSHPNRYQSRTTRRMMLQRSKSLGELSSSTTEEELSPQPVETPDLADMTVTAKIKPILKKAKTIDVKSMDSELTSVLHNRRQQEVKTEEKEEETNDAKRYVFD